MAWYVCYQRHSFTILIYYDYIGKGGTHFNRFDNLEYLDEAVMCRRWEQF